jgi:L-seryl-tRNA(Ser) seleniumtransferase
MAVDAELRQRLLRELPSVDELLRDPQIERSCQRLPRRLVVETVRAVLQEVRSELLAAEPRALETVASLRDLHRRLEAALREAAQPRLRWVINATGIVLHTGLGRAPLAEPAAAAVANAARSYVSLELELATGERGSRTDLVRSLLTQLTGAESATVVNNNAAATMIVLATVATGKEVIVSRGELIEIGGSFRLPEIMAASGVRLREVGTTNKTRLKDYESAIGPETGALLKVHMSNYRIVGFTESVSLGDLVDLGRRYGLPVIDDIGSGALVDFSRYGLTGEPVASHSVAQGADMVLFSGDKLLGGPQAGIIVGKRSYIAAIERHPLFRAFRVDKLTLAALEATLRLYLDPEQAWDQVPVLRMARMPLGELQARAQRIVEQLGNEPGLTEVHWERDEAFLGGGSLPMQALPTAVVRFRVQGMHESEVARRLRLGDPAVIPRIRGGFTTLDLRTVFPEQDALLVQAVRDVACSAALP